MKVIPALIREAVAPTSSGFMLKLHLATSPEWTSTVLSDLDTFLLDHAANERKASATAMTLALHYPDRKELVREMIGMAQEELAHFARVYQLMETRSLALGPDEKDVYVGQLRKLCRKGTEVYFLDRLSIAAVIEARGCERFGLLAESLPAGPIKDFYVELTGSEARHYSLFLRLARLYFDADQVEARLEEILVFEADVVARLPLRPRLH